MLYKLILMTIQLPSVNLMTIPVVINSFLNELALFYIQNSSVEQVGKS